MSNKHPQQPGAPHGAAQRRNIFSEDQAIHRFLRSRNELSERQRTAVELLLRGLSDQDVATQVGVDRGTVLRWRSKSIAFQRELDRQRRMLWEQSAAEIQSMVKPALNILREQLTSDDRKVALRAAATLLRFATPSRLTPASSRAAAAAAGASAAKHPDEQFVDDLIAYVDAPMPGQPGAPEDMVEDEEED